MAAVLAQDMPFAFHSGMRMAPGQPLRLVWGRLQPVRALPLAPTAQGAAQPAT
jgi:hypothetical protein